MQQTPDYFAGTGCTQNNRSKDSGETSQAITGGILSYINNFDTAYKNIF